MSDQQKTPFGILYDSLGTLSELLVTPNFNGDPSDIAERWQQRNLKDLKRDEVRCFISFATQEAARPYDSLFVSNSQTTIAGRYYYRLQSDFLPGGHKAQGIDVIRHRAARKYDPAKDPLPVLFDKDKTSTGLSIVWIEEQQSYALVLRGPYGNAMNSMETILTRNGFKKKDGKTKTMLSFDEHEDSALALLYPLPKTVAQSIARTHGTEIEPYHSVADLLAVALVDPQAFRPHVTLTKKSEKQPSKKADAPVELERPKPPTPKEIQEALRASGAKIFSKRNIKGGVVRWLEIDPAHQNYASAGWSDKIPNVDALVRTLGSQGISAERKGGKQHFNITGTLKPYFEHVPADAVARYEIPRKFAKKETQLFLIQESEQPYLVLAHRADPARKFITAAYSSLGLSAPSQIRPVALLTQDESKEQRTTAACFVKAPLTPEVYADLKAQGLLELEGTGDALAQQLQEHMQVVAGAPAGVAAYTPLTRAVALVGPQAPGKKSGHSIPKKGNNPKNDNEKKGRIAPPSDSVALIPLLAAFAAHGNARICEVTLPDLTSLDAAIARAQEFLKESVALQQAMLASALNEASIKAHIAATGAASPSPLTRVLNEQRGLHPRAETMRRECEQELKQLQKLRASVARLGTNTMPAIVIRNPRQCFGQDWDKLVAACDNPATTLEGTADRTPIKSTDETGKNTYSDKDPSLHREIVRTHITDIGDGKRGDRQVGVLLLSPELGSHIQGLCRSNGLRPKELGPMAIRDVQLNEHIADHYAPDRQRVETPQSKIKAQFHAMGLNALLAMETVANEARREVILQGKAIQLHPRVTTSDKGSQPTLYLAVRDAAARTQASKLLSALYAAGALSGQKRYVAPTVDASTFKEEYDALHALHAPRNGISLATDYKTMCTFSAKDEAFYRDQKLGRLSKILNNPGAFFGLEGDPRYDDKKSRHVRSFMNDVFLPRLHEALAETDERMLNQCKQSLAERTLTDEQHALIMCILKKLPDLRTLLIDQEDAINVRYQAMVPDAEEHIRDYRPNITDAPEISARFDPLMLECRRYGASENTSIPLGEGEDSILKSLKNLPETTAGAYILRCPLSAPAIKALELESLRQHDRSFFQQIRERTNDGDTHYGGAEPLLDFKAAKELDNLKERTSSPEAVMRYFGQFHGIITSERDQSIGRA